MISSVPPATSAQRTASAGAAQNFVRGIDVGACARPFFFISAANIFVIVVCLSVYARFIASIHEGIVPLDLVVFGLYAVPYSFAAFIAWRNLGVLNSIVQRWTLTSLVILLVAAAIGATLYAIFLFAGERTILRKDPDSIYLLSALVTLGMTSVLAAAAASAVAIARRRQIKVLRLSLVDLVRRLETYVASSGEVLSLPGRNRGLGIAMLALGVVWLLGFEFIPVVELALENKLGEALLRQSDQIRNIGFLFFLYSKYYFQPDATTLLKSDRRRPILFLRSFIDDEKTAYTRGARAFFDFSLESRLGGYFARIGPFIAVGSPKDKSAVLGASRAQLSDDAWQATVLKWMDDARWILLMPGTTKWVVWELAKVLARGHVGKLILVFPESKKIFGRREAATARLMAVRLSFAGTEWSPALAEEIKRPQDLRALVFSPGGKVDLIKSRSRGRASYQIAALVAHYLLLARAGAMLETTREMRTTHSLLAPARAWIARSPVLATSATFALGFLAAILTIWGLRAAVDWADRLTTKDGDVLTDRPSDGTAIVSSQAPHPRDAPPAMPKDLSTDGPAQTAKQTESKVPAAGLGPSVRRRSAAGLRGSARRVPAACLAA